MELLAIRLRIPDGANVIVGQAHFIKTVDDLAEAVACAAPDVDFGLAFNEASGPCLTRVEGSDESLRACAVENARSIGAGHVFVLVLGNVYPIHVLDRVKSCLEVCTVFCATANSVEVIVAQTKMGRAVLGVVDGEAPRGVEGERDVAARKQLLRDLGYKR